MKTLALLTIVSLTAQLGGQSLLDSLAREVCRCMTQGAEIAYPRLRADRCVRTVGMAHRGTIRDSLSLSVLEVADRRELGELLIVPLTRDCPDLAALAPGRVERSYRYSDINLATPPRPAARKDPPPLPPGPVPGESQRERTIRATYLRSDGPGRIVLHEPDGKQTVYAIAPRLQRRTEWTVGREFRITYRLDWQAAHDRIVPTITAVQ
jgi:hypothetical protein